MLPNLYEIVGLEVLSNLIRVDLEQNRGISHLLVIAACIDDIVKFIKADKIGALLQELLRGLDGVNATHQSINSVYWFFDSRRMRIFTAYLVY